MTAVAPKFSVSKVSWHQLLRLLRIAEPKFLELEDLPLLADSDLGRILSRENIPSEVSCNISGDCVVLAHDRASLKISGFTPGVGLKSGTRGDLEIELTFSGPQPDLEIVLALGDAVRFGLEAAIASLKLAIVNILTESDTPPNLDSAHRCRMTVERALLFDVLQTTELRLFGDPTAHGLAWNELAGILAKARPLQKSQKLPHVVQLSDGAGIDIEDLFASQTRFELWNECEVDLGQESWIAVMTFLLILTENSVGECEEAALLLYSILDSIEPDE